MTQPFSSYKLFFTANSSVSATYPIQASLLGLAPAALQNDEWVHA